METWKPILNFENYMVSDLGRIKSLPRKIRYTHAVTKEAHLRLSKEKILSLNIKDGCGYLVVFLRKNNKSYMTKIHRLVMASFKGESSLDVNHIDGNKLNNKLENLEYCTRSYNVWHAWSTKIRDNSAISKPIIQYSLDGIALAEFPSINEAERRTKVYAYEIRKVLSGELLSIKGFIWKYKNKQN